MAKRKKRKRGLLSPFIRPSGPRSPKRELSEGESRRRGVAAGALNPLLPPGAVIMNMGIKPVKKRSKRKKR